MEEEKRDEGGTSSAKAEDPDDNLIREMCEKHEDAMAENPDMVQFMARLFCIFRYCFL